MRKLWLKLRIKWARAVNLYLRLRLAYLDWQIACLKHEIHALSGGGSKEESNG